MEKNKVIEVILIWDDDDHMAEGKVAAKFNKIGTITDMFLKLLTVYVTQNCTIHGSRETNKQKQSTPLGIIPSFFKYLILKIR